MQTHRSANTVPKLLPNNNKPLVDRPNERVPSSQVRVHYDFPDQRIHPAGWYVRRHLKRKNLRRTNQQYQATDRVGIRWSIMPLSFAMIIVAALAGGFFAGYNSFTNAVNEHYQGKIATLVDLLPGDSLRMYDEHDILIYEAVDQGLQVSEPLNNISANLMHAEIAIEDQNFWTNPGYDITGIVRAALSDLSSGRVVAGGSTITQQLIKNGVVGNQDSAVRKLEEIILAPQATRYYTKQQLMDMYLNTTYYGNQAYGAEAAAFVYFDLQDTPTATAAQQLDIAQAAMLAGIPQNPTLYNPFVNPQATFLRMEAVLNQLVTQGYITQAQQEAAIAEAQGPHFLHPGIIKNNILAPHFVAYTL